MTHMRGEWGEHSGCPDCLVDLATGDARPVGRPREFGSPSWLPDGKGILIVDRKSIDPSKPSISMICRMDLDGRLTALCEGSIPVLLGDRKRILFEEQTSRDMENLRPRRPKR